MIIFLGDINAQISSYRQGLEHVIGPHGSSRVTNDNGNRFLMFCGSNGLCVGNTYFQHKQIHKKTWRSPNGAVENEIDYMCINQRFRSALQNVRVYRGADVGSHRQLLVAKVKLKLKRIQKPTSIKPIAVE